MVKKEKNIVLVTPEGIERSFEFSHAERILNMGEAFNGGWAIKDNNKYQYDKKNGIRLRSNKANSAKTK